jgi:hypothetical protein
MGLARNFSRWSPGARGLLPCRGVTRRRRPNLNGTYNWCRTQPPYVRGNLVTRPTHLSCHMPAHSTHCTHVLLDVRPPPVISPQEHVTTWPRPG